jgi:hypothetical protein
MHTIETLFWNRRREGWGIRCRKHTFRAAMAAKFSRWCG